MDSSSTPSIKSNKITEVIDMRFLNEGEDEMLNLGEIGKFKVSALEEFWKLTPSPIENIFKQRLLAYNTEIGNLKSKQIGLFTTIGTLYDKFVAINTIESRRYDLIGYIKIYYERFPDRKKTEMYSCYFSTP
jgi:hypothetical protein